MMHVGAGRPPAVFVSSHKARLPAAEPTLLRRGPGDPGGGGSWETPGGFLGDPGEGAGRPPGGARETPREGPMRPQGGARETPREGPVRPWGGFLGDPAEGPVRPWGGLGDPIPALPATARLFPARGPRAAARLRHVCGVGCRNPSREARRSAGWDSTTWERRPVPGAGLECGSPRQWAGGIPAGWWGQQEGRGCQSPSASPVSQRASGTSGRRAGRGCLSTLFFSVSRLPGPRALGSLSP